MEKPIILLVLMIVAGIVQILKNVLAKRAAKQTKLPPGKRDRTFEMEEELRKFLQSVAGQEITEQQPPKPAPPPAPLIKPPPVVVAPPRPPPLPPIPTRPPMPQPRMARSTVQIPAMRSAPDKPRSRIAAPLAQVTEPVSTPTATERLALLPRVRVAPARELAPSAPAVTHPASMERLQMILSQRPLIQQGIVLAELLGPPKALSSAPS